MYNAGQTFPSCGVVDIKKTRIFNHLKFAILWLCKFGIEIGTDMTQICVQECSGLQFQFMVSFMLALQSGSSYPQGNFPAKACWGGETWIGIGTDMMHICVQGYSGLQFQFTLSFMLILRSGSRPSHLLLQGNSPAKACCSWETWTQKVKNAV